jgi:arylsulfatase
VEPGEFRGVIGRDFSESTAWWPESVRARDGAPNVVFVVLDDVGFAQIGCFGSDIDTPVLDGLAARGLRYTNFHTTALCSPTRACLMTGRNHHVNGMGRVIELATGFPGYDARIPRANGFLSEMLVPHGYATFAVGKWHLTPEDECHSAAPRHRWPLSRGFERFYGFFSGETHQYVPALISDSHQVLPGRTPEEGYHLTEDLVDHAIEHVGDLRAADPGKPFFMYFCTGACHAPHQAPPEWIERYRGAFDSGWDAWRDATLARQIEAGVLPEGTELSPRPGWVPAWDSLSAPERRLYARYMEVFAGFLSHTDHHIGRLLGFLHDIGELDNTIVFVLSDNGASSEGGPTGSVNDGRMWNLAPREVDEALGRIDELGGPYCHNNYPWGWTVAGNTPFRRWKREVHEGGVADPLIVHWPAGIADPGGFRRQYVHAIDLLPTVLDVLQIDPPDVLENVRQRPVDGISFSGSLREADAPGLHETQYYEMFGCRAIYHRGWKAVTFHPIQDTRKGFDEDQWELYNVDDDPSECHDLARQHPAKLDELIERWWTEAGRNQVLPLDNRPFSELVFKRPCAVPAVAHYVCRPGAAAVPEAVAVSVRNRSHKISAEVEIPSSGAEGVIVAQGSGLGGWSFYVADRRLAYVHNYVSLEEHRVGSDVELSHGRHHLGFHFDRTGDNEGTGRLLIDGEIVGEGRIPRFTPARFALTGAGLTCGYSDGLPVTREYRAPFRFTGRIIRAVIDVDGPAFIDPEAEARAAIARQ